MAVGDVVMGEAATVTIVTLEAGQCTVFLIEYYLLRLQYYIATDTRLEYSTVHECVHVCMRLYIYAVQVAKLIPR